jgi:hypothetical protein
MPAASFPRCLRIALIKLNGCVEFVKPMLIIGGKGAITLCRKK